MQLETGEQILIEDGFARHITGRYRPQRWAPPLPLVALPPFSK